jgi:hypothetical protein
VLSDYVVVVSGEVKTNGLFTERFKF